MDLRLSAIHLYPVKGIRGIEVDQAPVEPAGLRNDRRWIIVDEQGKFLSQRSHPRMARISGAFHGESLQLSASDQEPLAIGIPDGKARIDVSVWRDTVSAAAAGPRADRWLSACLDHPCRLAYMDDACSRPITSSHGQEGESVSFADGYPLLLVSSASLADLNRRLDDPLPMDRFRPNLVVDGCDAFAEDLWRRVAVGDTVFRFAGLCARCSVTTVDQRSGVRTSEEPLRTLFTYRNTDEGVAFGVNLIPESTGSVSVGDRITIL